MIIYFLLSIFFINVHAEVYPIRCESHGRPEIALPPSSPVPLTFLNLPKHRSNHNGPLQNFELDLKLLLLSATNSPADEPSVALIKKTLHSYHIPFDHLILTDQGKRISDTPLALNNADGSGKYYGVVTSTGQLLFKNEKNEFESSLTLEQWAQLEKYEKDFSVRRVSLYSYPHPGLGVTSGQGQLTADSTYISFDGLTKNLDFDASGLRRESKIPSGKFWFYPTQIQDSIATPFLYFDYNKKKDVGGITVNFADNRKQMHFFFSQDQHALPSILISALWVNWLTKGIYQGKRRIYFNIQVDDFFLSTRLWEPTKSEVYRVNHLEIDHYINWQKSVMRFHTGNRHFKIELAFNGAGVQNYGTIAHDQLYHYTKNRVEEFNWVSHTFSHPILNDMTFEPIDADIKKNIEFADNFFGPLKIYYSPNSIVTPGISGLFNKEAIRSLFNNQIMAAVGDNSRPELTPIKPYQALYSTEIFNGMNGLLIIPRHPTHVYFNASTPQGLAAQYNAFYPQFGGKVEFEKIFNNEVNRVSRLMFLYDPAPHMFHQANLRLFDYKNNQSSLLSLWMEKNIHEVRNYVTLPILSLQMDQLAHLYKERMALDDCGVLSSLVVKNLKVTSIKAQANGKCRVPITGIEAQPQNGIIQEKYGPDQTLYFEPENTSVINLKTPLAF